MQLPPPARVSTLHLHPASSPSCIPTLHTPPSHLIRMHSHHVYSLALLGVGRHWEAIGGFKAVLLLSPHHHSALAHLVRTAVLCSTNPPCASPCQCQHYNPDTPRLSSPLRPKPSPIHPHPPPSPPTSPTPLPLPSLPSLSPLSPPSPLPPLPLPSLPSLSPPSPPSPLPPLPPQTKLLCLHAMGRWVKTVALYMAAGQRKPRALFNVRPYPLANAHCSCLLLLATLHLLHLIPPIPLLPSSPYPLFLASSPFFLPVHNPNHLLRTHQPPHPHTPSSLQPPNLSPYPSPTPPL
ncbi:unnamed protein product [Closterium sp. NIES-65]|nr:unnamed protein product [Closterium sp. NIES-65]